MSNLKEALEVMEGHAEADRFIQGNWLDSEDADGVFSGCFFGCAMQTDNNPIEAFCKKYGMPLWLGCLSESIFEGIGAKDARLWPVKLLKTMVELPSDFDYESAKHELAVLRLTKLFDTTTGQVKAAIGAAIEWNKAPENDDFRAEAEAACAEAISVTNASPALSAESAVARAAAWAVHRAPANSTAMGAAETAANSASWATGAAEAEAEAEARPAERGAVRAAARVEAWGLEAKNLIKVLQPN